MIQTDLLPRCHSLAMLGSPPLLRQLAGKKCCWHTGMPSPLQRSQRLHSSWPQPRVQAGWQGTCECDLHQTFGIPTKGSF